MKGIDFATDMMRDCQVDINGVTEKMRKYIVHSLAYSVPFAVGKVWKKVAFSVDEFPDDVEYYYGNNSVTLEDALLEPLSKRDESDLIRLLKLELGASPVFSTKDGTSVNVRIVRPKTAPERLNIEFILPAESKKIRNIYNELMG